MAVALTSVSPLTLALSPEGRGDDSRSAGESTDVATHAEPLTSPLRGEGQGEGLSFLTKPHE